MKTLSIRNVFAALIVGALLGTAYFTNSGLLKAPKAEAVGENVSGYVWSDTIGWIELSGSWANGVSISPLTGTGVISGSAWSAGTTETGGIGWISFDRTKTGNPPSAPFNGGSGPIAQVDWATGNVTGWARALSACQNDLVDGSGNCTGSGAGNASGGWDGWIKLSGSWTNGVHVNPATGKFSGYAWGGAQVDASGNSILGGVSVVGWIDFAPNLNDNPLTPISNTAQGPAALVLCDPVTGPWGVCTNSTATCTKPPDTKIVNGTQYCTDINGTISNPCSNAIISCTNPTPAQTKTHFWQF